MDALRRDHRRHGRRRRHARAPPRPFREADPAARARRLAAARARELARPGCVRRQQIRVPGHVVRREGHAVPAAGALLRRRRDEAVRRGALPAAAAGLRRASPSRRDLAGLADQLRRARALLHAGRAGLRGPRRARRGSDRAAGERAVPVPGRLARAPDPAARRRSRGPRLPPVPRAVRDPAQRAEHAVQRLRAMPELRRLPVRGAREVGRRGARRPAGARAPERHAADEREGGQLETNDAGTAVTAVVVEREGETERFAGDIVVLACGAANTAALLLSSANDKHPNGLANGSDQVGRNYMFHASRAVLALSRDENPTVFQKTLGLNDFYFGSDELDYPLGNIQMVGKSQAPMFRGEKPTETKLAPSGRSRRSRSTRSTSGSRPRTCRCPRTG